MLLKHSLKALILRELTKVEQLNFAELVSLTKATPGNLGRAIQTLIAARYIRKIKTIERSSIYAITVKGNQAYANYKCELLK